MALAGRRGKRKWSGSGWSRKRKGTSTRFRISRIRNSENPVVSVIIPVLNERKTIRRVIAQASRVHPHTEVIVVANGSSDGTVHLAQRMGAKVIEYQSPLGHDVGRKIGAMSAKGNILLFTDGDIVIPAKDLACLVKAVELGHVDIALNKYQGPIHKEQVHPVVMAKHALNCVMLRSDLGGASMTTIPHAIHRKAYDLIGEYLMVPPVALTMALHHGLRVKAVHWIDVGRKNPIRRRHSGNEDPLKSLIIGDHLEAIHWLISNTNLRGNRSDLLRNRDIVR